MIKSNEMKQTLTKLIDDNSRIITKINNYLGDKKMALLAIEGFDHLHGNDFVKKGFSGAYSITSSPSYARFGGQGIIAAATSTGPYVDTTHIRIHSHIHI